MRIFSILLTAILLSGHPVSAQTSQDASPVITYVQRAEAVMILLRSAAVPVSPSAASDVAQYDDVIADAWYAPYIAKGIDTGMITPDPHTGLIEPHKSVSRAEFLRMLTKVFDLTMDIPYNFIDVPPYAWYARYAGLSYRYGLFGGDSDNRLFPELRISHAQAMRAITTLLSKEPQLHPSGSIIPRTAIMRPSSQVQTPPQQGPVQTVQAVRSAMLRLFGSRTNTAAETKAALIARVNAERARYKLAPLTINSALERAAQKHAEDMDERGYFSHFTPEGLSYVDRIRAAGYLDPGPRVCSCPTTFRLGSVDSVSKGPNFIVTAESTCACKPVFAVGENIAKGQFVVDEVVDDWMNSPPHRQNILRKEFTEIGIGIFGTLWTQTFGDIRFE